MTERTFSVPLCVLVCPCQYGGGLTLPYFDDLKGRISFN